MDARMAESALAAVEEIVARVPRARILICGSLYLAGGILRENG
jgi:dihydrofolate synthase/folylpolyglutamate synthase